MAILILIGGLLFALAGGGVGAFLELTVWSCLGLGVLAGTLGVGALVSAMMWHAARQEIREQPWQDRRKEPRQDRRKQPLQLRPWQERRKAPWQNRRKEFQKDLGAGGRAAPEWPFMTGR